MIVAALTQRRPGWRQSVRRLSALALGFAGPLLLCGIYFHTRGALQDLLTTQFVIAPQHAELNRSGHYFGCMLGTLSLPVRAPLYTLGLLGLVPVCFSVARKRGVLPSKKLLVGWFAVGLVVIVMHGSFAGYHFMAMFAPLAILSADMLHTAYVAGRTSRDATWWLALAGFLILVSCAAYKLSKNVVYEWWALHGERPADYWDAVSAYVKKHTAPGDRILVWGTVSGIYLDADRNAASRFMDTYHVAIPPRGVDYRGIFLREFQAAAPKYFILSTKPRWPGPCGYADADYKETFAEFDALSGLIAADYRARSQRATWDPLKCIGGKSERAARTR